MNAEAMVSMVVSYSAIFLEDRRAGYYDAQVKKQCLLNEASTILCTINSTPSSFEELDDVVEGIQEKLQDLIKKRDHLAVLEDDYPTVGKEEIFPDGAVAE